MSAATVRERFLAAVAAIAVTLSLVAALDGLAAEYTRSAIDSATAKNVPPHCQCKVAMWIPPAGLPR